MQAWQNSKISIWS